MGYICWTVLEVISESSWVVKSVVRRFLGRGDWLGVIFISDWGKNFIACQLVYVHSSLSVCVLADNRSAAVCVLRSPADLCSVLPVHSVLATSQSPNILCSNHTSPVSHSDKTLPTFTAFYSSLPWLPPFFIPVLGHLAFVFTYIPTHIFDLSTVVSCNESASCEIQLPFQTDKMFHRRPWSWSRLRLCVVSPGSLRCSAVRRRQTQACCG